MGKRIIVRRRGRGTSIFKSPTHKRVGNASIPPLDARELDENFMGEVKNLIHDPGKGVPLAHIVFENGQSCYLPAPEGLRIGQEIRRGSEKKKRPDFNVERDLSGRGTYVTGNRRVCG